MLPYFLIWLFSTGRPLTQLFGALAIARQFSQFHQSIKVTLGSHSHSWWRQYNYLTMQWGNLKRELTSVWSTCQGFFVVFPHGHEVLQTGVELLQNPLLATIHMNVNPYMFHNTLTAL